MEVRKNEVKDPDPNASSGRVSPESISRSHPECPHCGLPTFRDEDSNFFCASCEGTFEGIEGSLKPKLFTEKKKSLLVPIVVISLVVMMIIISTVGIIFLLRYEESGLIDIDDVAEIRELEAKYDVSVEYMKPSLYDDYVQSSLDEDRRRELWELERFYECMLVMDPKWDLVSLVENSSSANVLAFYDTETENITIIEGSGSEVHTNYILSHELTHALQDQNFDLDSFYPSGSFDQDLARLAVIEGDAMITMEMWAEENLNLYQRTKLSRDIIISSFRTDAYYDLEYYNEIISEMEYFPYIEGMEFVNDVYATGGYNEVNELYTERTPLSTEQILHFEKFLQMEPPEHIDLNIIQLGMEVSFETTVGEKLITEILPALDHTIGILNSNRTDIGWGGDRFVYLENGSDFLSIFATQWDTGSINDVFHDQFHDKLFWHGAGINVDSVMVNGAHMSLFKDGRRTYILRSNDRELLERGMSTL